MHYVATLVSPVEQKAVTEDVLDELMDFLPEANFDGWLNDDVAADIGFTMEEIGKANMGAKAEADILRHLADQCRTAIYGVPVDIIIQRKDQRRKKLFLADMDSTMIGQECIDELADFVGMKEHVSAITERAMRGEIAFEPALRERVALLKGLAENIVDKVIAERITLTPGGRELVQTMRANGAYTALVSGGFTLFTSRIGATIGFHEDRSNLLLVENGKFAGAVAEPILGKEAKLASLIELREKHKLSQAETMAVGDGANDLAMLGEAGLGVAFHAKPAVAAAAHARIDHGDLTALLYAQGYQIDDFVA